MKPWLFKRSTNSFSAGFSQDSGQLDSDCFLSTHLRETTDLGGDEDAPVRLAVFFEIVEGIGECLFEIGNVLERHLPTKSTTASQKIKMGKSVSGVVTTNFDESKFGIAQQNHGEFFNITTMGKVANAKFETVTEKIAMLAPSPGLPAHRIVYFFPNPSTSCIE